MITYLLPTRNRPDRLDATLRRLGALDAALHEAVDGAEVVVVDDASDPPVTVPSRLANGFSVRLARRIAREGAAARNAGARMANGQWLVMLDDDSYPIDASVVAAVHQAAGDVAAVGGQIVLPGGRHEHGGLPEVFVGCGAAIRRDAFLAAGGYDGTFDYYAEEYDLCARLVRDGWRITHDWRFRVRHEKVANGRDIQRILARLVRNNGWVIQRYAPEADRAEALRDVIERYAAIARREHAEYGFERGLDELMRTIDDQPRRPLTPAMWDRFTGLAHVRATLERELELDDARVAVVDHGKHAWAVPEALRARGDCEIVEDGGRADLCVIATLSPGPMMDAWERRRTITPRTIRPWIPGAG